MDQKLWKNENFRRSMGGAGKCWSQLASIDHISPKSWARRRKMIEKSPLRVSFPIFEPYPYT